jgi:hypothetical protein
MTRRESRRPHLSTRDSASCGLALALLLLPPQRRDWAEAMQAELAAIADPATRRRYAMGCARAVSRGPGTARALGWPVAAWAVAISLLTVAVGISGPARAEVCSVVVLLGGCCWLGRRPGYLGPAASHRSARRVRAVGCATVAGCLCFFDVGARTRVDGGSHDSYGWVLGAALLLDLVTLLAVTARGSTFSPRTLGIAGRYAGVAVLGWWIAILLFGAVRATPHAAILVVAVTSALSARASFRRLGNLSQSLLAGLGTAVASCLLIFVAAVGTYALLPRLVPDSVGGIPYGGLTPAAVALDNRVESTDPYVPELLLGPLGGMLVIATMGAAAQRYRPSDRLSAPTLE